MDNFGLIDALNSYCENKGYYFIYGSDAYINCLSDSNRYEAYEKIIIADFTVKPVMENGVIQELRYIGVLSVGQKSEGNTSSSLDETPQQKYDRRLKDNSILLTEIIADICCENELSVQDIDIKYDLNKFDLNADFVASTLTFVQ